MKPSTEVTLQMLNDQVLPIERYADNVNATTPPKDDLQVLSEIINNLYRKPGPLNDALHGDLVTLAHAGGEIGRVARGPMPETLNWALLKLAQDLVKTQPERAGLTPEKAAILNGKLQTTIDKMRTSGLSGLNTETEMNQLDAFTDTAIAAMKADNLLHLTRVDAARIFPESQIKTPPTATPAAPKTGF